ncbi:MAG TPA: hypothetical protein VN841_08580 [Bryobacteraceae bacterium]|nr:hypothetical protein [Bryobacteraceae bacterium]
MLLGQDNGVQPQLGGLEEFKRRTALKLEGVRCPDHRQPPRLKFRGASLRDVSVEMSGCCAKLIEIANRAIAQP